MKKMLVLPALAALILIAGCEGQFGNNTTNLTDNITNDNITNTETDQSVYSQNQEPTTELQELQSTTEKADQPDKRC